MGLQQRSDRCGKIVAQRPGAVAIIVKFVDEPDVVGPAGTGQRNAERFGDGFSPLGIIVDVLLVGSELQLLRRAGRFSKLGLEIGNAWFALFEKVVSSPSTSGIFLNRQSCAIAPITRVVECTQRLICVPSGGRPPRS